MCCTAGAQLLRSRPQCTADAHAARCRVPRHHRRDTPAYKVNDIEAHIDPEPGGKTEMSDHESANKSNFTLDGVDASLDIESLVSSSSDTSTAYTCSSDSDMLVSANGSIDQIPIPRIDRVAFEDPIDGSEWRLAMETEIKGKLEVD